MRTSLGDMKQNKNPIVGYGTDLKPSSINCSTFADGEVFGLEEQRSLTLYIVLNNLNLTKNLAKIINTVKRKRTNGRANVVALQMFRKGRI